MRAYRVKVMVQVTFDPRDGADCKVVRTLLRKTKRLQHGKAPPKIEVPAHGSKYATVIIEAGGKPLTVGGGLVALLREIAGGAQSVRIRAETLREIRAKLPWLMDSLHRDEHAKVINKRIVFKVGPGAAGRVALK